MRNKVLSFFLVMTMLITCIPVISIGTAYASVPEISISGSEAKPGDSVELTVYITGNPGITSIDFYVDYDSSQFTLTKVENGELLGGTMNSQSLEQMPYYCGWINALQKTNCVEDGTLLTMTFQVKDGAVNGRHAISFSNEIISGYDADIKTIEFKAIDGYIEVKCGTVSDKPGDSSSGGETMVTPIKPVQPDADDEQISTEVLTKAQKKTIAAVEEMKIFFTESRYNKKKKTYFLKYVKSNKAYRLDGYQIYRSTKVNKGFKKIVSTTRTYWTDKKIGAKGSVRYYKIRGFRKVAGKTYYTKWSSKKKLVVK